MMMVTGTDAFAVDDAPEFEDRMRPSGIAQRTGDRGGSLDAVGQVRCVLLGSRLGIFLEPLR
jgi:hypothetical protein